MPLQVRVTEQELMQTIGRLTVESDGLRALLERCTRQMTPEQLAAAGIEVQNPTTAVAGAAEDVVTAEALDAVRAARNGAVSPEIAGLVGAGEE